jgi:hypothetical protein
MAYRVTVRINEATGAIELFQVDDISRNLPLDRHDAEHDLVTGTLGALVERRPDIEEVVPHGGIPEDLEVPRRLPGDEEEDEHGPERGVTEAGPA